MRASEFAGNDEMAGGATGAGAPIHLALVLVAGVVLAGVSAYELIGLFYMGLGNTELSTANVAAGSRAIKMQPERGCDVRSPARVRADEPTGGQAPSCGSRGPS